VTMVGTVRRASLDDVEAVGHVHYAAHVETYSGKFPEGVIESFPVSARARMWTRFLNEDLGELWVAECEGRVVGFASTGSPREESPSRDLELGSIYLLASHHGSGLGQELLDVALSGRRASLWVLDDNPRAHAFYVRNGFSPDGMDKVDEYFGGVREIRMTR
jgi:L-amino acid N-acyltransferase YncA